MIQRDDEDGTGTRVDLGDDLLLEKTRVIVRPPSSETPVVAPPSVISSTDLLQNARILRSEGFLEEAKHSLHRVLIQDASSVEARQLLAEIHASELKQIFGESGAEARPRYGRSGGDERAAPGEAESLADALVGRLEEELDFSLIEDTTALPQFAANLEHHLQGASAQDRVDLGIAFLEMGLYPIAEKLFIAAALDDRTRFSATSLLAYTHIRTGNFYAASAAVQPILHDAEVAEADKTEFFYLLGRAHEGLGQMQVAQRWYRRVMELEPDYRDVRARFR